MERSSLWLRLRVWWYLRNKPDDMPKDVREYIVRRYMKDVIQNARTPEEKQKLSAVLLTGGIGLEEEQMSMELKDEMVRVAFKLLDDVPRAACADCQRSVFVHEAITIDGKLYCSSCGASSSRALRP